MWCVIARIRARTETTDRAIPDTNPPAENPRKMPAVAPPSPPRMSSHISAIRIFFIVSPLPLIVVLVFAFYTITNTVSLSAVI